MKANNDADVQVKRAQNVEVKLTPVTQVKTDLQLINSEN